MSAYEVESYELKPVEGDAQIELIIHAKDGNTWEYGIPYNSSGRYMFEEIDVIEMDFGSDFREELAGKLEALVERLTA